MAIDVLELPIDKTASQDDVPVVVIGGGPSGLTAAYELMKLDVPSVVIEKRDIVGGLARTEQYKGFHFDMGGHRFFTKSAPVTQMWHEVLAREFIRRPRLSRIYYKKRFFYYPLKPLNALRGLGLWEAVLNVLSYFYWQLFPYKQEDTFEQWVTNRFGRRLFLTFFKTYTEKVWGIPCTELKAEWAAQRIKDLSLKTALVSMFVKPGTKIKTLIEEFDYPRLGPGQMWTAVKDQLDRFGSPVVMRSDVVRIRRQGARIRSVVYARDGQLHEVAGRDFISSMPVSEFVQKLDPPAPPEVVAAAGRLNYRDFLTVCLVVSKPELFPDNWIYVHDPEVHVGRIQCFKNWSPHMVPDPSKSSLGLEYFCNEGDALWSMPDRELVELGKRELVKMGLAQMEDIEDGCVFRVEKSYPVYDSDYREYLGVVRDYIESLENFQTIGRNGLHRYNNQDHAMLTGMYAVRNLIFQEQNDLWAVNTEQEYHEEVRTASEADELDDVAVDEELAEELVEANLSTVFRKIDRMSLGLSMGVISGLVLFLMTGRLIVQGGPNMGQTLQLLNHYLPGFQVTWPGAFIGLAYGTGLGFVAGWLAATLRNSTLFLYVALTQHRAERQILRKLLEFI